MSEYPFTKIIKKTKPKPGAWDQYFGELTSLGTTGLYEILDKGKQWSSELMSTLQNGGGAIFPHTYISKCGDQIGAVIHAILDSQADHVIALGTAHAFPQLFDARVKEFNGENISHEPSWGLLKPESSLIKDEFSLHLFKELLKIECNRRGKRSPQIIERYPCLTNRKPGELPGIRELKELTKNAVLVGTDDYCHHGIAYCVPPETAMPIDEKALAFARKEVEKGYALLNDSNYSSYFDHWMNPLALGDPSDVTAVIHYLVGNKAKGHILDIKLVDVSGLFENDPSPSWVAATLGIIEMNGE